MILRRIVHGGDIFMNGSVMLELKILDPGQEKMEYQFRKKRLCKIKSHFEFGGFFFPYDPLND